MSRMDDMKANFERSVRVAVARMVATCVTTALMVATMIFAIIYFC